VPLVYKSDSSKGIWGIQDIVCATENDSRRNNRSYNPSAILSGIAPRRSRVLDSKYALTSLCLVSHVVCCPLVYSSKYITVQLAIWCFFYYFFFDFSTCIYGHIYDIMPYAINMHKSTLFSAQFLQLPLASFPSPSLLLLPLPTPLQ